MEDMDEVRTASGTVADFSGWNVENKYGKMKITSSEKIIEPVPEEQVEKDEKPQIQQQNENKEKRQVPGKETFNISVASLKEVKELAKRLLPRVNEVKQSEYKIASELAIGLAMTFEGVWNNWEKNIGGNLGKDQ